MKFLLRRTTSDDDHEPHNHRFVHIEVASDLLALARRERSELVVKAKSVWWDGPEIEIYDGYRE